MFRESDYKNPVPHKAFKATPTLQLLSQASPMDAEQFNKFASLNDVVPRAVPATHAVAYNPEHPDADWNGLVIKSDVGTRRHETDHPSQRSGIAHTERGIVSIEEKQQWPRKRRDDNNVPVGDSGGKLLGGLGTPQDPYLSSMALANTGAPTSKEQMTLAKQCQPAVHQPSPRSNNGVLSEADLYSHSSNLSNNTASQSQFAFTKTSNISSQRAHSRSFLSNIGNSLVNDPASRVPQPAAHSENQAPKVVNRSANRGGCSSGSLW